MEHGQEAPSPWVERWAPLVGPGARVLDLACGHGRHARLFASRGALVTALDRDEGALASLAGVAGVATLAADVEGGPWPFGPDGFDAVVVTRYLHRPLFGPVLATLRNGGILVYETFMLGNEKYGRPSNPEFLLRPGELLEAFGRAGQVIAFEQGFVESPKAAVVQRLCLVKADAAPRRIG